METIQENKKITKRILADQKDWKTETATFCVY
jgi:hypothetical protein